jgi:hypothetical protein
MNQDILKALNLAIESIETIKKNTDNKSDYIKAQLLLSEIRDGQYKVSKNLSINQYNI